MNVQIWSSHSKGNAPAGYLIARVEIAPGLYAESERNPYTNGEWRWIDFRLGDCDAPGRESVSLCEIEATVVDETSVARKVSEILRQISELFDSTTLVLDLRQQKVGLA